MFEGNPIIRHKGRDPRLFWYEPGRHWVIAVYDERDDKGQCVSFYTSPDLKAWTYQSSIQGYFECPEIFEAPVQGEPAERRWVLFAADASYAVGRFDGKSFTPEHEGKQRVHYGAFYASQRFNHAPDGRIIQVGWARVDTPGMAFNQAFTLPIELTLRRAQGGVRLFAEPVREVESLRLPDPAQIHDRELTLEAPLLGVEAPGQLYDIEVEAVPHGSTRIELRWGTNSIAYDLGTHTLGEMPLPMDGDTVRWRVLVDRPMYEVVGGAGACYLTSGRSDAGKPLGQISLRTIGGACKVSMRIHTMGSIWPKPE